MLIIHYYIVLQLCCNTFSIELVNKRQSKKIRIVDNLVEKYVDNYVHNFIYDESVSCQSIENEHYADFMNTFQLYSLDKINMGKPIGLPIICPIYLKGMCKHP